MEKQIIANNLEEAVKALRNMAEMTAKATQNWDNFEEICRQVLKQVYEAGQKSK